MTSAAFSVVAAAPFFATDIWLTDGGLLLGTVWNILVFMGLLRLATVFPAIAVDAPSAGLRQAYADGAGHARRVFAIALPVLLPLLLLPIATARAISALFEGDLFARLIVEIGNGLIDTIVEILFLVIASRLYQSLGAGGQGPH